LKKIILISVNQNDPKNNIKSKNQNLKKYHLKHNEVWGDHHVQISFFYKIFFRVSLYKLINLTRSDSLGHRFFFKHELKYLLQ
jgi:hypothetical protein